jgi:hypothetical protein
MYGKFVLKNKCGHPGKLLMRLAHPEVMKMETTSQIHFQAIVETDAGQWQQCMG